MQLEHLTANFAGPARRIQENGREYVVAPVSMIVPGTLAGNRGPIFYPLDEIARNAGEWTVPILYDHPYDENNEPVSANADGVWDRQGLGYVRSPSANGKLAAMGWFDVELCNKRNPDLVTAIERGQLLELSTGLGLDAEAGEGEDAKGRPYVATARNLRPDHLAVFWGDKTGACSIADGCGVNVGDPVANELVTNPYPNEHAARIAAPGGFMPNSFRRKQITPGVSAIFGKKTTDGPMVLQAYRFDNAKFTAVQARKWLADHNVHPMEFVAAKATANNEGQIMPDGPTQNNTADEKRSLLSKLGEWLGISNAMTKTVDGKALPASAFAYVPDPNMPNTWALRIDDAGHVGGAAAAIGPKGYRGKKVDIPAADRAKVKAKVRAAWKKFNPDKKDSEMPVGIRNEYMANAVTVNFGEMSLSDVESALRSALYDKLGISTDPKGPESPDVYVQDVYQTYFIYRIGGKMYSLGYGMVGGEVKVSDADPVEVQRMTVYKPVGNEEAGAGTEEESAGLTQEEVVAAYNQSAKDEGDSSSEPIHESDTTNEESEEAIMPTLNQEQRKALVDGLIANCECWDEADRETLNKFDDAKLVKFTEASKKAKDAAAVSATVNAANPPKPETQPPAFNEGELLDHIDPKWLKGNDTFEPVMVGNEWKYRIKRNGAQEEDLLQRLPENVRQVLREGEMALNQKRQRLIDQLLVHVPGHEMGSRMDDLKGKSTQVLEEMVSYLPAQQRQSSYVGNAMGQSDFGMGSGPYDDEDDTIPVFGLTEALEEDRKRAG